MKRKKKYLHVSFCACKDPYTLHLTSAEDAWQKKHLDRDGHDENKRESQRCHSRHDRPEDSQTDHLYRSVQMHPQGPHLRIQSQKISQDTQYKPVLPSILLISVKYLIPLLQHATATVPINEQKTDWGPDLAHVGVIGVVFRGHQQQKDPFCHLDTIQ